MRLGRAGLARGGLPTTAGRWSLTAPLLAERPPDTARQLATAMALLERHGVITRSAMATESLRGGFAAVYGVLRAAEEQGSVRRGYFIEGLGGAQFATAAAVEQLRAHRDGELATSNGVPASEPAQGTPPGDPLTGGGDTGTAWTAKRGATTRQRGAAPLVLAATDPAQPFGAALDWPATEGRPTRSAGAHVVLADGAPLVFIERSGRGISTFEGSRNEAWVDAARDALAEGRSRPLELEKIDGKPASSHPLHDWLIEHGFTAAYRGPTLRS